MSTDLGDSRRPVNSSNSCTWRCTAGATDTGGGPNAPGEGVSALDWQAPRAIDPVRIRTPRSAGARSTLAAERHNKPIDMMRS